MSHYSMDKENEHPNMPRRTQKVREEDFSAIGKHYVLDGERVRVKSIHYRDESKMPKEKQQPLPSQPPQQKFLNLENLDEGEVEKLEYLQKMNVINEEEKAILENIRMMRKTNLGQPTHQSRMVLKKPSINQPLYAPPEAYNHYNQHFYYPPHQQDNGEENQEQNYNYY